jgi:hypothetical protein
MHSDVKRIAEKVGQAVTDLIEKVAVIEYHRGWDDCENHMTKRESERDIHECGQEFQRIKEDVDREIAKLKRWIP